MINVPIENVLSHTREFLEELQNDVAQIKKKYAHRTYSVPPEEVCRMIAAEVSSMNQKYVMAKWISAGIPCIIRAREGEIHINFVWTELLERLLPVSHRAPVDGPIKIQDLH